MIFFDDLKIGDMLTSANDASTTFGVVIEKNKKYVKIQWFTARAKGATGRIIVMAKNSFDFWQRESVHMSQTFRRL